MSHLQKSERFNGPSFLLSVAPILSACTAPRMSPFFRRDWQTTRRFPSGTLLASLSL